MKYDLTGLSQARMKRAGSASKSIDLELKANFENKEEDPEIRHLSILTATVGIYNSTFKTNQQFIEAIKQGKRDTGYGKLSDEDFKKEGLFLVARNTIRSALIKAGYRKDMWTAEYTLEGIPFKIPEKVI